MRSTCLRRTFLAFNLLFWLFGVVLMALGLFAEFDSSFVHRLVTFVDGIDDVFIDGASDSSATSSSTEPTTSSSSSSSFEGLATYVRLMSHGVIALGAAISFVAFFGFWGACRETKRCLGLFFALVLLCLLLTLLLGGALFFAAVAAGANRASSSSSTASSTAASPKLDPVVAKIAAGFKTLVESAWNALTAQQRLSFERANSCCSLYDPQDLANILGRADCGSDMASRGCFDKVVSVIGRNFAIFGAAMVLLAAIEVAALSISCVLFQRIRIAYGAV